MCCASTHCRWNSQGNFLSSAACVFSSCHSWSISIRNTKDEKAKRKKEKNEFWLELSVPPYIPCLRQIMIAVCHFISNRKQGQTFNKIVILLVTLFRLARAGWSIDRGPISLKQPHLNLVCINSVHSSVTELCEWWMIKGAVWEYLVAWRESAVREPQRGDGWGWGWEEDGRGWVY